MNEEFKELSKEQAHQVCKNLGSLASSLQITHEAIAIKVGFERPSVTRLFSGRYSPRLDIIFSVLTAINELSDSSYTLKDIDVSSTDQR